MIPIQVSEFLIFQQGPIGRKRLRARETKMMPIQVIGIAIFDPGCGSLLMLANELQVNNWQPFDFPLPTNN
jgi:hypothetical protein